MNLEELSDLNNKKNSNPIIDEVDDKISNNTIKNTSDEVEFEFDSETDVNDRYKKINQDLIPINIDSS